MQKMASLNGILTYLEHIDSKKNCLRKAILTLAVKWKDLDEHLDSTKNCFDACVIDLELKQKNLESNQDYVAKTFRELDEVRESLDLRLEEFERKEENFHSFQLAQVEELEMKEKRLDDVRMWIEERIGECEMREEKLSVQKKSMEALLQKIEMEKEEFEEIQKSVDEKLNEIHLKERNYEDLCKEVSSIQDRMETWAKELNLKEEQLMELQKLNEERGNELDIIARECKLNEERLSVEKRLMEVKLDKFEMEKVEFEDRKKSVDEKLDEISFKERKCDSLSREANLIQDWIERRSRELYLKEEEFTLKEEQLIAKQRLNQDRTEELEVLAREYELKGKNFEMEKEEFQNSQNFIDKKWNEISLKEKRAKELDLREEQVALREEQLQAMQRLNEECCEELHLFEKEQKFKEERLNMEKKSMEEQLENIENEKKKIEDFKRSVVDKLNEISLKEKNFEDRSRELNSIQDWIERRARELDLSEEQFAFREQQLKLLEKFNEDRHEELEVIMQKCKLKEESLCMEMKSMEVLLEKINKEKEDIDDNKKNIAKKFNEVNVKERKYEDLSKEVNLLMDRIDKWARELDSKEEQVVSREQQLKAQLNKELCEEVDIIVPQCKSKKELTVDRMSMEVQLEKIEKEKKQFEDGKGSVADKLNNISLKHKNCQDLSKEVDGFLEQIERWAIEFDSKKEPFALREEQIKAIKKLNKERCEELFIIGQECKFIEERVNGTKKSMEVLLEEIEKEKESLHITQECKLKKEMHSGANTPIKVLLEKFEKLKEGFEDIQKLVGKKLNDIGLKERNYDDLSKEIQLILDRVERQTRKLDWEVEHISLREEQRKEMQKLNEECSQDLEIIAQELDSSQKLSEEQRCELDPAVQDLGSAKNLSESEKLNWNRKQLDLAPKQHISQCFDDLHTENKQFNTDQKLLGVHCLELDSKEKQLEERMKDFELKLRQFEERSKDLRLEEKQINERTRENLSNEKQLENVRPKQVLEMPTMNLPVEIQPRVAMDGRRLLLYVKEHHKNLSAISNEVFEILQSSTDPAKLVLEAMEGFYPLYLKKGDVEFDMYVARSYILLLEGLMMLSPQIMPHVREAALGLAGKWKVKMKLYPNDLLEVEAFILLLASYKLASDFDADELLEYMELCAMRPQAPQICRALDLTGKVPDLITSLIRNNKHWVAVKFIVEFELVKRYPPLPLLKDYVRISKKLIKARCSQEINTVEAQDNAIDERMTCLRNVINCIKYHKIESGRWRYKLENRVRELREQKSRKWTEPPFVTKNMVQKSNHKNLVTSTTTPVPGRSFRPKKVFSFILANMDGRNLLVFLNKHVEEQEQMRKDVYFALRMASDSAKLVLDVLQVFYTSHLMKGDCDIEASVVRTCTFLLEVLMGLSPVIKPQVEKVAKDLAVAWKLIILKQTDNGLTLGFLFFICTYGLISDFDSNELLKLYQTTGEHKQAPELIRALGFSEEILVSSNLDQSAPEDQQLSNTVTSALASDSRSSWNGIPDAIRYACDPAQIVLDAVEGCYYSMLTNRNISKVEVMKNFRFLLSRLVTLPLEVKLQVNDQASQFANDWKEKVKHRDRVEVGCLLLFLAAYRVVSTFPMADLLNLLEIAYDDKEAYRLFCLLGLSDEVPDFIRRLVERGEHLGAIKYVCAFNLVNIFSPVSILEDYISSTKEEAEKIRERGQNSRASQEIATRSELRACRAMMDCIRFHQLELQHPFRNLEALIKQWEIQIFGQKKTNKQRKRRKGFLHELPSDALLEPHHPEKRQRAALSAERMMPNCSESSFQPSHPPSNEYLVEPPPNAMPPIRDYCLEASIPVFPYTNRNGPGGIPNGFYPMFAFGGNANFDPRLNYNVGPVSDDWPHVGTQSSFL